MPGREVDLWMPAKLRPVFAGDADVRGAYGGRGSGKTRTFATMAAVRGLQHAAALRRGVILCARQFMNSLADSSLEEVKRAIQDTPWLAAQYDVGENYVRTRDGRVAFVFAGLNTNIASIKSKARILLCWIDEAEPVTDKAFEVLEPTLREEGTGWRAELWVTWNPRRRKAAVETRYRNSRDPNIKIVEVNWRDNKRFPARLERQRQRDLAERPLTYPHVWDGAFETVHKGAYFTAQLTAAHLEHRILPLEPDPMQKRRVFIDIGGTGAKADAFALWGAQTWADHTNVLDYYEAQGQDFAYHLAWLHLHGYTERNTIAVLPHDGATQDKVFAASYEGAFQRAGYSVIVVPNQGRGAALARVDALRQVFPRLRFNDEPTRAGRECLAEYHERWDEEREIGLGPEHDASSHGADALGLMAIVLLDAYTSVKRTPKPLRRRGSAMAA